MPEMTHSGENHADGTNDHSEAGDVVPSNRLLQIKNRENGKNHERNDFLNGLQLGRGEFVGANAVGGNLEAVFEERDHPTEQDYLEQGYVAIFQVAIPGKSHENI